MEFSPSIGTACFIRVAQRCLLYGRTIRSLYPRVGNLPVTTDIYMFYICFLGGEFVLARCTCPKWLPS